jgi:hypothetical protein
MQKNNQCVGTKISIQNQMDFHSKLDGFQTKFDGFPFRTGWLATPHNTFLL